MKNAKESKLRRSMKKLALWPKRRSEENANEQDEVNRAPQADKLRNDLEKQLPHQEPKTNRSSVASKATESTVEKRKSLGENSQQSGRSNKHGTATDIPILAYVSASEPSGATERQMSRKESTRLETEDLPKQLPVLTYSLTSDHTEKEQHASATRSTSFSEEFVSDDVSEVLSNQSCLSMHRGLIGARREGASLASRQVMQHDSLLDDLSINVHMTETEDDEEDHFGIIEKREMSFDSKPRTNSQIGSPLACETPDESDKIADLSVLQTESELDNLSLAVKCSNMDNTGKTAESDDFLNRMLTTLMVSTSEDTATTGDGIGSFSKHSSGSTTDDGSALTSRSTSMPAMLSGSNANELVRSTTEEAIGAALLRSFEPSKRIVSPIKPPLHRGEPNGGIEIAKTQPSLSRRSRSGGSHPSVERQENETSVESNPAKKTQRLVGLASAMNKSEKAERRDSETSVLEEELDILVEAVSRCSSDQRASPLQTEVLESSP
ncbi:MAG: hypothetical protein SGILL_007133, partial [Bacillariaceae sp.]